MSYNKLAVGSTFADASKGVYFPATRVCQMLLRRLIDATEATAY